MYVLTCVHFSPLDSVYWFYFWPLTLQHSFNHVYVLSTTLCEELCWQPWIHIKFKKKNIFNDLLDRKILFILFYSFIVDTFRHAKTKQNKRKKVKYINVLITQLQKLLISGQSCFKYSFIHCFATPHCTGLHTKWLGSPSLALCWLGSIVLVSCRWGIKRRLLMLLLLVLKWCPLNLLQVMDFGHCRGLLRAPQSDQAPRRTPLPPVILFSENPTLTANYKKRTMAWGLGVGWDRANDCTALQCIRSSAVHGFSRTPSQQCPRPLGPKLH